LELSAAVYFVPHRAAAVLATVFVFVPIRENQEQGLSYRNGPAAFGAIELNGLKFVKIRLLLARGLPGGGREIKWSFLHGKNLWILGMDHCIT